MKQSYRFEHFLLSILYDIPVQLRYLELNDTQQALFSSSPQCNRQAAHLMTSEDLILAWHGMVWYGMVWYGMVWYVMVWYGMVWYGMV